jgi:hypothetical protein
MKSITLVLFEKRMKHTLPLLTTLLLAPLASFAAPERPNVLFICADQEQRLGPLFRSAGFETAYAGKVHVVGGGASLGFTELKTNSGDGETVAASVAFLKQKHQQPFRSTSRSNSTLNSEPSKLIY